MKRPLGVIHASDFFQPKLAAVELKALVQVPDAHHRVQISHSSSSHLPVGLLLQQSQMDGGADVAFKNVSCQRPTLLTQVNSSTPGWCY